MTGIIYTRAHTQSYNSTYPRSISNSFFTQNQNTMQRNQNNTSVNYFNLLDTEGEEIDDHSECQNVDSRDTKVSLDTFDIVTIDDDDDDDVDKDAQDNDTFETFETVKSKKEKHSRQRYLFDIQPLLDFLETQSREYQNTTASILYQYIITSPEPTTQPCKLCDYLIARHQTRDERVIMDFLNTQYPKYTLLRQIPTPSITGEKHDLLRAQQSQFKEDLESFVEAENRIAILIRGLMCADEGHIQEAIEYYRDAAHQGNTMAMYKLLACKISRNMTVSESDIDMCREGAQLGNLTCKMSVAIQLYNQGERGEAFRLLEEATQQGSVRCFHVMGGFCRTEGRIEEAIYYYTMGSQYGDGLSIWGLIQIYRKLARIASSAQDWHYNKTMVRKFERKLCAGHCSSMSSVANHMRDMNSIEYYAARGSLSCQRKLSYLQQHPPLKKTKQEKLPFTTSLE